MLPFQGLESYKKAKLFHRECMAMLRNRKHDNFVINQLGRASFSVPLNIAEGSGKFTKKDRKNYLIIARASVFECIAILDILTDDGNLSRDEFEAFFSKGDELSRMLYVMIQKHT